MTGRTARRRFVGLLALAGLLAVPLGPRVVRGYEPRGRKGPAVAVPAPPPPALRLVPQLPGGPPFPPAGGAIVPPYPPAAPWAVGPVVTPPAPDAAVHDPQIIQPKDPNIDPRIVAARDFEIDPRIAPVGPAMPAPLVRPAPPPTYLWPPPLRRR